MALAVSMAAPGAVPGAAASTGDNFPYRCTLQAFQNRTASTPDGPEAMTTTRDRFAGTGRIAGVAPVVWTTLAMLDRARERVASGREPYASQWALTKARADQALGMEFVPYQGPDRFRYFDTANPQAQSARDLAISWHLTGDDAYLEKARELLLAWANDAKTNTYPGSDLPHAAGLAIGRVMVVFGDTYAMTFKSFDRHERKTIDQWFTTMVDPIKESMRIWREGSLPTARPPFLGRQYFNNHLAVHAMGLAAIAFVTGDARLAHFALDDPSNIRNLDCLINGAILMPGDFGSGGEGDVWYADPSLTEGAPEPIPGEIFDRYRVVEGAGQVYAMEHLRLLALTAELAYNNGFGRNWYRYVGKGGENLEISFDLYADFFITGDEGSVNNGYYVHERGLGVPWTYLHYYELVARHYPNNARIAQALCNQHVPRTTPRPNESLGFSSALLYGPDLDC